MPKLTGIDAEIAYQLSQKKETVKYYSKITALLYASIPLVTKLWEKKETEQPGELLIANTAQKVINWTVWVLILVLAVITYLASYYTVSSIFWPEPLSIVNCLLLVPCAIYTGADIWDKSKLVFSKTKV